MTLDKLKFLMGADLCGIAQVIYSSWLQTLTKPVLCLVVQLPLTPKLLLLNERLAAVGRSRDEVESLRRFNSDRNVLNCCFKAPLTVGQGICDMVLMTCLFDKTAQAYFLLRTH